MTEKMRTYDKFHLTDFFFFFLILCKSTSCQACKWIWLEKKMDGFVLKRHLVQGQCLQSSCGSSSSQNHIRSCLFHHFHHFHYSRSRRRLFSFPSLLRLEPFPPKGAVFYQSSLQTISTSVLSVNSPHFIYLICFQTQMEISPS